MIVLIRWNK